MRAVIVSLFFFVLCFSGFSQQTLQTFRDPVFKNINRMTMTYADTLKADIYFVPGLKSKQRSPLLVLVHGGGFSGGARDGDLETEFALAMAQRGYVVASVSYDLVRKGAAEGFGCDFPAEGKIATFDHVAGNIHQALDYLLNFSKEFNFDPEKVVLAGSSAGAESVLHAAYATGHPSFSKDGRSKRKFAAVVAFAGALIEGVEVNRSNGVPAFLVHGTDDRLVPYGTAPHHFCDEGSAGYLVLQGSATLADALETHGVPSTLITVENGGHEWANKAYGLTTEVSAFLYDLLFAGNAGTQRKTIAP